MLARVRWHLAATPYAKPPLVVEGEEKSRSPLSGRIPFALPHARLPTGVHVPETVLPTPFSQLMFLGPCE